MLIHYWHKLLETKKYDLDWHIKDVADEMTELSESKGLINRLSELSDVSYTYSRTLWSGHKIAKPLNSFLIFLGYFYMIPKYTLRWLLFYSAGKAVNPNVKVRAVRNPGKTHKLDEIATEFNLDSTRFKQEVEKRLKYWVLLK